MSFRSRKNGEHVLPFPGHRALAAAPTPEILPPLLPVLIVLHQETSTPGRVGNALRALGHTLDIRRPRFGDPLPETLELHTTPPEASDALDPLTYEVVPDIW